MVYKSNKTQRTGRRSIRSCRIGQLVRWAAARLRALRARRLPGTPRTCPAPHHLCARPTTLGLGALRWRCAHTRRRLTRLRACKAEGRRRPALYCSSVCACMRRFSLTLARSPASATDRIDKHRGRLGRLICPLPPCVFKTRTRQDLLLRQFKSVHSPSWSNY